MFIDLMAVYIVKFSMSSNIFECRRKELKILELYYIVL